MSSRNSLDHVRKLRYFPTPGASHESHGCHRYPLAVETAAATKKAAASTATTDTVSLSAEARAAAAGGLPIFATDAATSTTDTIADVATKVKQEERAKADNSKADKLESAFLDEQATKLDKVDRLDGRAIQEEQKKKQQLDRLIKNGAAEEQAKKDRQVRVGDRAKTEEAQKQVRYEKVSEKFAGTDQLAPRLEKLKDQAGMEERKKQQQATNSVDRGVREDTKKGETLGNFKTRAIDEENAKGQRLDRLGDKFKEEARRKQSNVLTVAEKGAITPTEAKELTALVDKNLEEREKGLAVTTDNATTGAATTDAATTDTAATIDSKPGMGGTATSMASSIQYAADIKK